MNINYFAIISFMMICVGQNTTIQFENINSLNGLSQNTTYSVFQDSRGYLYIGMEEGFTVFDGKEYQSHKPNAFAKSSLNAPYINGFQEDKSGLIWIASGNGISRYNVKTKVIDNFSPVEFEEPFEFTFIHSLFIDSQDRLWVMSNNGIFQFIKDEEVFIRYSANINFDRNYFYNGIQHFYENHQNVLLYGNQYGLFFIDDVVKAVVPYTNEAIQKPIRTSVRSIIQKDDKSYLIGTDKGVFHYEKNKEPKHFLKNTNVVSLVIDLKNRLWVGTRNNGLYKSDKNNDKFENLQNDKSNPYSLTSNTISSLYIDHFNVLWVASRDNGLSKLPLRNLTFQHYKPYAKSLNSLSGGTVRSFEQIDQNTIWIGTESNGLNSFDMNSNRVKHIFQSAKHKRINGIKKFENRIYLATELGLVRIDEKSHKVIQRSNLAPSNLDKELFLTHIFNYDNDLWIGTRNGIFKFNSRDNRYHEIHNKVQLNSVVSDINFSKQLGDLRAHYIENDSVWFGLWGKGLYLKSPVSDFIQQYTYNGNTIKSISSNQIVHLNRHKGKLWISLYGGGVNVFDGKTFTYLNEKNGLPSDIVNGVLFDDLNRAWISTNKGLVVYDLTTYLMLYFKQNNGLQGNEFVAGSVFKDNNGFLYFGGDEWF